MTTRRQWLALVAAFGLLQGAIAVGSVVLPALSGDVGLEGIYFDVRVYHEHARKAVTRVPYRDYVVEYPLLAFPIFYAPILITRDPTLFARLIGAEMLLANLACLGLVARHVGASAPARVVAGRLTWYTLAFAGLCPMLLARFDLVPTALAFAAALGWFGRRPILGGTLAALGALVKIFPALIAAPALLLALRRPRLLRGHVAFALVLALGVFCWWSLGGDRVLRSIQFQTGRGLEVGSTYAGLLVPLGWLTGRPTAPTFDNNAMHLASPWSSRVASLVLPIQALALLLILALSSIRRRRPTDPFLLTCSLLVALIATGKVLSPQYLIWLLPFLLSLNGPPGRVARPAFLAIVALTSYLFPHHYYGLLKQETAVILALNARNLLLLALALYLAACRPQADVV